MENKFFDDGNVCGDDSETNLLSPIGLRPASVMVADVKGGCCLVDLICMYELSA